MAISFAMNDYGRRDWVVPTMGGEFYLTRRFGYGGVMGGNLTGSWRPAKDASIDTVSRRASWRQ